MRITFLRHAHVDFDTPEGATNNPHLSDKGKKQAAQRAFTLNIDSFDHILVSPLRRAQETANILTAGGEFETVGFLQEMRFPDRWNGGSLPAAEAELLAWLAAPMPQFLKGLEESVPDHKRRVGSCLKHWLEPWAVPAKYTGMWEKRSDDHILMISHQFTISAALEYLMSVQTCGYPFFTDFMGTVTVQLLPVAENHVWSLLS